MADLNNNIEISDRISLIKISHADQSCLLKLMHDIYPQTYAYLWQDQGIHYVKTTFGKENLKKELARPDSLYCFIRYKSEICGILRILDHKPCPDFKNRSATKLHRIYINAQNQGLGIGRQLLQWLEKRTIDKGLALLWLEVMDSQPAGINFYKKMGFQMGSPFELSYKFLNASFKGMYRMFKHV